MTDWKELITAGPEVMVGKPVLSGTRLTVEFIVERLPEGWTEDELLQNYPGLTREQIHACLAYAAEMLGSADVLAATKPTCMKFLADQHVRS